MDISLHRQKKNLKFYLCVPYYHIEGTVSQIFHLGLSFCFMKSRKLSFKLNKSYPFLLNKIKTKALIKNLRHDSLHVNVLDVC